jgi:N-acetylglucosamine-6-phosphate deacetylase
LDEVLLMATSVPAEAMGLGRRKAVLMAGADADLVLLDADLNICMTIVAGQVVYQSTYPV